MSTDDGGFRDHGWNRQGYVNGIGSIVDCICPRRNSRYFYRRVFVRNASVGLSYLLGTRTDTWCEGLVPGAKYNKLRLYFGDTI
jgi:hypothetical protein